MSHFFCVWAPPVMTAANISCSIWSSHMVFGHSSLFLTGVLAILTLKSGELLLGSWRLFIHTIHFELQVEMCIFAHSFMYFRLDVQIISSSPYFSIASFSCWLVFLEKGFSILAGTHNEEITSDVRFRSIQDINNHQIATTSSEFQAQCFKKQE